MENAKLKKSQVTLELALAFIVILLLFGGGLNIWFKLNNRLVTQSRDYQSRRLASGQGNITIPGEEVINATLVQLDEATMAKIAAIQGCDCIDDTLKKKAIDLYTQQYQLGVQIQTCSSTISALNDSIAAMRRARSEIPWFYIQTRKKLKKKIEEAENTRDEKQRELGGLYSKKTDIDSQIRAIEPELACCAGVL